MPVTDEDSAKFDQLVDIVKDALEKQGTTADKESVAAAMADVAGQEGTCPGPSCTESCEWTCKNGIG